MTERDDLDRSLALARQSLRGPVAMKARVRARLAQAPPTGDTPPPLRASWADAGRRWARVGRRLLARRLHLGTVALLVGAAFGVGLWLGRQPLDRSRDERPAPVASARRESSAPPSGAVDVARATDAPPTAPAANPGRAAALPERRPERSRRPTATATSGSVTSAARGTGAARSIASATRRAGAGNDAEALTDDALAEEIALLERVERAIRAGEANLALALLAQLDREIAVAALPEERAAARVLALCVRAGARAHGSLEATEAKASAERFLAASPASVYADRIATSCPRGDSSNHRRAGIEEVTRAGH